MTAERATDETPRTASSLYGDGTSVLLKEMPGGDTCIETILDPTPDGQKSELPETTRR
ncbi:MAG: hypothetical protein J0G35_08790 [Acidobacteriales bacterium]|nr:hypothetical protein [Terriglobales bacterium]